jgi:arabinogalactan endo-1,4-beta-galactosidase
MAQDAPAAPRFYFGVDVSYINQMEDCGAVYRVDGQARDPYTLLAERGANLARVRLWHSPTWTTYSTFDDAAKSLRRARDAGMATLLDFHYSDTWADPGKQTIPAAWADLIDDTEALGDAVYAYTYETLMRLDALGLMPNLVQVGNEINTAVLRADGAAGYPIDWARNATLLNRGIQAVRDAGRDGAHAPRIMLHIAKPEEVEGWLLAAQNAGVTDFEVIGISYYVGWSRNTLSATASVVNRLRHRFGKEVMIAETAYPWTLQGANDSANNILDAGFLADGYPATPAGQRDFMADLTQAVLSEGGLGVVYWEPAWVSTPCRTQWGQGSHWENATFFDFERGNALHEGIDYLSAEYAYPVSVTLRVEWAGDNRPERVYVRGDFLGMGRQPLALLPDDAGVYTLQTRLMPQTELRYQVFGALPATPETALIGAGCTDGEGTAALTVPDRPTVITVRVGACPEVAVRP